MSEQLHIEPDRLRRGDVAGDQPVAQGLAMPDGAAIENGVDQGDADRPAKISHQVEQAAGVGHLRGSQRAQRQTRRRQEAEHDRDAAQDLRPEHLVEIGDTALECA